MSESERGSWSSSLPGSGGFPHFSWRGFARDQRVPEQLNKSN